MNINCKMDFLITHDNGSQRTTIRLHDDDANINFCEIELTDKQLVQLMSRLGHVETHSCKVYALDKVGKKRIHSSFEVKYEDYLTDEDLYELAKPHCPEGYTVSKYFGSKSNKRYDQKTGESFLIANCYKWVNKEESEIIDS